MTNDFIELTPLTPQPPKVLSECAAFDPVYTEGVCIFIRSSDILCFNSAPNVYRHDRKHASLVCYKLQDATQRIYVYETAKEIMEKLK